MGKLSERVAYLSGLADGMELDKKDNGKIFTEIISVLEDVAAAIDEHDDMIMDIEDCVDDLCDAVEDIDDYLSDDDDDDEDDPCCSCGCDELDECVEIECPNCGETVCFTDEMLDSNEDLICPNCNEVVVPKLDEDEE